jgi:hypothetical protein
MESINEKIQQLKKNDMFYVCYGCYGYYQLKLIKKLKHHLKCIIIRTDVYYKNINDIENFKIEYIRHFDETLIKKKIDTKEIYWDKLKELGSKF